MAADMPYLLERDTTVNHSARSSIEQSRLTREHERYEDDEDPTRPFCECAYHGEDLRCDGRAFANRDRDFYPPAQPQYNDMVTMEPGRRGRLSFGQPPYYAADEELESGRHERMYLGQSPHDTTDEQLWFGRRGRRPTRGPPSFYSADNEPSFGAGRHGGFRRHRFGTDRLPFRPCVLEVSSSDEGTFRDMVFSPRNPPPRDMHHGRCDVGMGDFDENFLRDVIFSPRNPRSSRRLDGSRDMSLQHLDSLEPRVRRSMAIQLENYDDDFDWEPRARYHDIVRGAGRYRTGYGLEDEFEDDVPEDTFRDARGLTGYRSDLDFQSIDDDIEDQSTGGLRIPTAAERRHRWHLGQMHSEVNAEDRQRQRQEAQFRERYAEKELHIEYTGRGHMSRNTGPPPTNNLFDGNVEDYIRGRQCKPSRPRDAEHRQKGRKTGSVQRFRGRTQQAPSTYNSLTPTQVSGYELTDDTYRPPVAAATFENQKHAQGTVRSAKNGDTARDGARAIRNPNNPGTAPGTPSPETAPTSRAEIGDNGRSDSSDSDSDTPDDDSEIFLAGDESSERGDVMQSFIHITL